MRNYNNYDPIKEGFDSIIAANKGSKEGPKNPFGPQAKDVSGLTPGQGAPMMENPSDMQYWKMRLMNDRDLDTVIQQDMSPMPYGSQTIGGRYA